MLRATRSATRTALTRNALALAATVAVMSLAGSSTVAAQAVAGTGALAIGQMAPDFTLKTVTSGGLTATPFKLSDHKGETVVLAFFPKARTSGCTTQMTSYRDQYATLMNGGQKVTLIGISVDPDTALTAWAQEAKFQFMFGSDADKAVGEKYGAATARFHSRILYVIAPDGKISYVASPFKQLDAAAYTDLGTAVDKAAGMK